MDEDAPEDSIQTTHRYGSKESSQSLLEQDLYLSVSDSDEEDDDDVCHEVDEET